MAKEQERTLLSIRGYPTAFFIWSALFGGVTWLLLPWAQEASLGAWRPVAALAPIVAIVSVVLGSVALLRQKAPLVASRIVICGTAVAIAWACYVVVLVLRSPGKFQTHGSILEIALLGLVLALAASVSSIMVWRRLSMRTRSTASGVPA